MDFISKSPMNLDRPNLQPFYHFVDSEWKPISPNNDAVTTTTTGSITTFRVTTWNIDFQMPCKTERTTAALQYLSQRHFAATAISPTPPPGVILLQEMVPADLEVIKSTPWIQEKFYITDLSHTRWGSGYGTTTLIEKRLSVQRVFRVPYSDSFMHRDGLFVDVAISNSHTLRLCNTHLESLTSKPPKRPLQLKLASQFMHGSGPAEHTGTGKEVTLPTPHGAILAEDLNAFAPEDRTAPEECNLHDAFLVLGGEEGSKEGFTWGQKVSEMKRERFGCSRMDKVLFCGGCALSIHSGLERDRRSGSITQRSQVRKMGKMMRKVRPERNCG